jgi:hypothetical protein
MRAEFIAQALPSGASLCSGKGLDFRLIGFAADRQL